MKNHFLIPLIFSCLSFQLFLCLGKDVLPINEKISQDNSSNLISKGKKFQSGFFSLPIGNGGQPSIVIYKVRNQTQIYWE